MDLMEDILLPLLIAALFVATMILPHYWHKKSSKYRG